GGLLGYVNTSRSVGEPSGCEERSDEAIQHELRGALKVKEPRRGLSLVASVAPGERDSATWGMKRS
ncbi:MAG: hypothetical protein IKM95_08715, partial [Bacteroidales bacterium]|nr:hypothetical protein [Bacteroidales bacterium]